MLPSLHSPAVGFFKGNNTMDKIALSEELMRNGWVKDRWGKFRKDFRRITLSKLVAKLEYKTDQGWVRQASAYYDNISVKHGYQLSGFIGAITKKCGRISLK